jgi:hypothetical protein
MCRRAVVALALVLAVACGSSAPAPATPQDVALKSSDLPKGMGICGLSGDADQFVKNAPSGSSVATQIQQDWAAAKTQGVQKGYVRVFAGSKDQCTSAFTAQSLTGIKWAAGMAIQFKTPAAASKFYGEDAIGAAEIAAAPGAEQGSATGLGASSLTFGDTGGGQSVFFAYWQNGRFVNVMLTVGVPEPQARQAARNVNSRIH